MAHALTNNMNGQVEFFYTGKKPWHGLGQELAKPATASEAIKAANLGWTVSKHELLTVEGFACPKHRAVIRDDNNLVLSVLRAGYELVQNTEAFAFFDSVVGTGEACYETAGSIDEGRRIFLVAKLPEVVKVAKDDVTEQFLTLVNTHDGTGALRMFFTPIRVVCQNTLNAALSRINNRKYSLEEGISIRHIGDIQGRIADAQDALGLARRYYKDFQDIADALVQKKVTAVDVEKFLKECFEVDSEKPAATRTQNSMDRVQTIFADDPKNNLDGIQGSAWALYNAACQYADYETMAGRSDNGNRRMSAMMFGSGARFKQRALSTALAL